MIIQKCKRTVSLLLVIIISVFFSGIIQQANSASKPPALGFSKSFPEGGIIKLSAGQILPPYQSINVDNAGGSPAEVLFEFQAPSGIILKPKIEVATIAPGNSKRFHFSIEVLAAQAPGDYPVTINVKQTNVPVIKGKVVFAPAVGASFVVRVSGESGGVEIRSLSKLDRSPATGVITLGLIVEPGLPPVTVAQTTASLLEYKVAPGNYLATFETPGLTTESKEFIVLANQTTKVELLVTTIYFVLYSVIPQPSFDDVKSVKLVTSFKNNMGELRGSFVLNARIFLNEVEIERIVLQKFDLLNIGLTDVSEIYLPADGWKPGVYSFEYELRSPTFSITVVVDKQITIAHPIPWIPIGAAVLVLVILGALIRVRNKAV